MVHSAEELLHLNLPLQLHHAVEYGLGARRAAGDVNVYGHDFADALHYVVTALERSAGYGAAAHGHNVLRLGHLVVKTLEGGSHLVGDRTGAHDEVGLAGRVTRNLEAEACEVVTGATYGHELDTAAARCERKRPQRVAAAPVNRTVKRAYHYINTTLVKLFYDLLERLIVLEFRVRNTLDDGFSYFHSSAPFRQA